jgi:RNA polymerase sigma-70 factor (ECF subfamily)
VLGRSVAASRQLASRGRRRVQSGAAAQDSAGTGSRTAAETRTDRQVVEAFLTASRTGDLAGLLAVLAPDVVLRADQSAVETAAASADKGAPLLAREVRGAAAVAESFRGRAGGAVPALVGGSVGFTWAPGGTPRAVFAVVVHDGRIASVDLVGDPAAIAVLGVELLG